MHKEKYAHIASIWDVTNLRCNTIGKAGCFSRREIPAISGYAPKQHRNCVDLMIMKKDNNFEYSSQRKLGILDAEFNNNKKVVAKIARDNGLKLGALAVE